MLYRTDIPDGGGEFKYLILNIDEGNAELTGGLAATPGNLGSVTIATNRDYLNLTPRKLYLRGITADGKTVSRSIIACDPTNALVASGGSTVMAFFTATNTVENVTMFVSGVAGEKRTLVRTLDSGLDDGDAE